MREGKTAPCRSEEGEQWDGGDQSVVFQVQVAVSLLRAKPLPLQIPQQPHLGYSSCCSSTSVKMEQEVFRNIGI